MHLSISIFAYMLEVHAAVASSSSLSGSELTLPSNAWDEWTGLHLMQLQ